MKHQYEDYIEYQARLIIQKLSVFVAQLFLRIRYMLNDLSLSLKKSDRGPLLKLGIYYPIGLLIFIFGMFLLLRTEVIFSPDYIVYFFLTIFFTGIFLLKK